MSDSLQVRKSLNFSTRTLVDNWHSVESDRYPNNEAQSTPMATFKAEGCKNIDPVSNDVNAEVHALLSRLKQLVGKVNVNQFLDELKEVNTSGRSEESMSTDSESSDENIKKAEQPKARFALTSQQIAREHDRSNSSAGQVDERSRYMLGANRFSIRASQLPDDLLNYVSGTKLLRANTRTPNFTMSPDPYACLSSPGKPLQAASNPISLAAASLSEKVNTTSETTFENANFQEFCVIGVESDMLFGLKSLERSSLQPTEVSCVYPTATDRLALVSNLNDYCFPFGAELRYVTRKELDRLNALSNLDVNANGTAFHNSKQSYGLQYQIMQFTDTVGVVHYATCVISSEPLERVGRQLHENMDLLQKKTRASNTIKRYMFFFAYKRKVRENRELRAKWASNMRNAHISIDGSLSVGSGLSKTGKASRSFFKAMRRVMGGGAAFHPPHLASGHESSSGSGSTASGSTGSISEESDNESPAQASGRPRASTVSSSYSRNNLSFHLSSPATPPSPRSAGRFTGGIATLLGSPLQRQRTVQSKFKGRALFTDFCAPTVFAEVHVDGSPSMSRTAALKLAESDRKVAVITQKAYCIISSQPMHALFFQVLEAIALKERDRALMRWSCLSNNSGGTALAQRNSITDGMFKDMIVNQVVASSEASTCAHSVKRNKFLSLLQTRDLSRISKGTEERRSVMSYSGKLIDIADQSYISTLKIMPRSLTLREWTTALLISLIPSDLIVKIHSLLLQEQSLLVYGEDAGMVTAITTAFVMLLQPFSWEGIFVPLLPLAAYEALDAPVPYVIGVVGKSRPTATITSSAGVLSLDDFIHHPEYYVSSCFEESALRHTMAARDDHSHTHHHHNYHEHEHKDLHHDPVEDGVVGLKYFESPCPEETMQGVPPLLDPMQCSQLKELHQLIAFHAVKINVCLHTGQNSSSAAAGAAGTAGSSRVLTSATAIKAVLNDLNDEALRSLTTVLARVQAYNSSLCGEVLTQPGGWQQFGVLNTRSNQFEFLPDLLMAPLKANLLLQESVINTQLFVSFMDQQSVNYLKLQPQRIFLGEWLYFRMHQRRKRLANANAR